MAADDMTVTDWIGRLKAGDPLAASRLWERYFHDIVRLARRKLGDSPRVAADEEDVAISAFKSLCLRAARGQFHELNHRDDLWQLLVMITVRKAINQRKHQGRGKRGGGRVRFEADRIGGPEGPDDAALGSLAGEELPPEFGAMMNEELRRLFDLLADETLRRIARLRMDGHSGAEIAVQLACNRRTVARKLELICARWAEWGLS
jgi:DNA-directed RNA polymerase specialized sigma24 family protein